MSGVLFVSVVYWMFALMLVFPPSEVASAGLTIEALLGGWLGSESLTFVQYHMRRTAATCLAHTLLLPGKIWRLRDKAEIYLFLFLTFYCKSIIICVYEDAYSVTGYVVTLMKAEPWVLLFLDTRIHSQASVLLVLASLLPAAAVAWVVLGWWQGGWQGHPLAASLAVYASSDSPEAWKSVAADINTEFRRWVERVIEKWRGGGKHGGKVELRWREWRKCGRRKERKKKINCLII